jgi:hypothetical protein
MKIYNNLIPETDTDADVNYTYKLTTAWNENSTVENENFVVYTTPGTYTWTCPTGVTSVSAVAIGAGGRGTTFAQTDSSGGGGGGGLGWKNNISVTPGTGYTVVVGSGSGAGQSYFINASTVAGNGGGIGSQNGAGGVGGTYVGDGGGNGGNGGAGSATDGLNNLVEGGGGGGAGGYNGNGGNGASGATLTGFAGSENSGAAGGGASGDNGAGNGGGGVSVYGIGLTGGVATGSGGSYGSPGSGGFEGGVGGVNANGGVGGLYGGGGGGADDEGGGNGGNGAVAIFYTSNYFSTTIKTPTPLRSFSKFFEGVNSSLASPFLQIENITSHTAFDTTANKWLGGVLANNDCIYGTPFSATTILKINTLTDQVTTFGNISGTAKYVQGVLAHTGNIYFVPGAATNVLKLNTSNDSISTIAFPSGITSFTSNTCACASDSGHIFIFGENSGSTHRIMRLTPSTDTLVRINISFNHTPISCILAPNNYIYIESNNGLLKFNPKNFDVSVVDASTPTLTSLKLAPDGNIFRSDTSSVRVFNPQTDTQIRSFDTTSTGSGNYSSMSFDGKLVTINLSGSIGNSINIRVIDTVTENVSFFNIPSRLSANQFAGIVRGSNGDMYLIPYTGRYVSKINFNISNNFSSDFYLSKYM